MADERAEAESGPVATRVDGGVGWVVMDRPRVLNAVDIGLAAGLEAAVRGLATEVRAIVLTGSGGNFSVGGDHREVARLRDEGADRLQALFDAFGRACTAVEDSPAPVIAAVDGYALAGGFELMQACDLVLVSAGAVIGDEHAAHGMIPGGGSSQRLPRLLGRQRALALLLTGRRIDGREAVELGLALRSVPAAELDAAAAELAGALATRDPAALREIKRLVHRGSESTLAVGLAEERQAVVSHLMRPGSMASFSPTPKEIR